MPIPKPKAGESQEDFVSRCHSSIADEYTDQKQRHAICMTSWRESKKVEKNTMSKNFKVQKTLKELDKIIKSMEREKIYKGFVKEIPKETLDLFSLKGQQMFKTIYLDNRIAGVNKSESLQLTQSMIVRSFKDNKITLLKGIEKALKRIVQAKKAEFLGDEESIENFPPRDEIPVIEDDDDENIEKSCGMGHKEEKAEEGDTKMIFGKPFTYSGGKWVPEDGGKKEEPEDGEKSGPSSTEVSNLAVAMLDDPVQRQQLNDLYGEEFQDSTAEERQQMVEDYISDSFTKDEVVQEMKRIKLEEQRRERVNQLDEKEEKAEEGDTKMIFGKPFTYSGGKWIPDNGNGKKDESEDGEDGESKPEDYSGPTVGGVPTKGGIVSQEFDENNWETYSSAKPFSDGSAPQIIETDQFTLIADGTGAHFISEKGTISTLLSTSDKEDAITSIEDYLFEKEVDAREKI